MKIKITERGWAGHFIGSSSCRYHRNTLIEFGNKRIVVSTVGNYRPDYDNADNQIGCNRYYETMAFEAKKEGVYWEADVSKQVYFESDWAIGELKQETDLKADQMHNKVVEELSKSIISRPNNLR